MAETRLEAYDLQVDYALRTDRLGAFSFYAIATMQPYLERRTLSTASFLDSVGFNNGQLKYRGNAGVSWERGAWNLGWDAQYYHSYFVYAETDTPTQAAWLR